MAEVQELKIKLPESMGETASQIIERNGAEYILFTTIEQDPDADNPVEEEGTANGHIYSANRRHKNFNVDAIEDAVLHNPDHVKLSYYEHGLCRWSVQGDSRPGEEFTWDGARFAGVWIPDKGALENIDFKGTDPDPAARRARILKYAEQVVELYTQWCNGEVYGYNVDLYRLFRDDHHEPVEEHNYYKRHGRKVDTDSCWGFFGWDTAQEAAADAARNLIPDGIEDRTPVTTVTLDTNELATVLAALRLFQREFEDRDAFDIREALPDHFGAGTMPLSTPDIDALCEKINGGDKPLDREAIAAQVSAYYTAKMGGKVSCLWDEDDRMYSISGTGLPAAPELREQYPNGWSMVDTVSEDKAARIVQGLDAPRGGCGRPGHVTSEPDPSEGEGATLYCVTCEEEARQQDAEPE